MIRKGSDKQRGGPQQQAPPTEPLHNAAQERGERAHGAGGGGGGAEEFVDITLNPRGGGGVMGGGAGSLPTTPLVGPGSVPQQQGGAAAADAPADSVDLGGNGRPVIRYNPFGADAKVMDPSTASPATSGEGQSSASAQAAGGEEMKDVKKIPEVSALLCVPALLYSRV